MTTRLLCSAAALRVPQHHTHVQKQSLFQPHLQQWGSKAIDKEEYVAHCIATVKETIQHPEYSFSEAGIKKASPLLEIFKEATSEASFINEELLECTHIDFKEKFCGTLEEKWSCDAAQSFYLISGISEKGEKVVAAQQWTHNYFCALNELKQWKTPFSVTPAYVAQFLEKTTIHFCKHARSVDEFKFKAMIERQEKDPVSFDRIMEKASEKALKDPSSLSPLEKEYTDFFQMCFGHAIAYFPHIDKKTESLRECVWRGCHLEQSKQSILESPSVFTDIFKE